MTNETMADHERKAYECGIDAAKNAATWVADGNSDASAIIALLVKLGEGDPAAYDSLPPAPNLSGEWSGDPTPQSLAAEILGDDASPSIYSSGAVEAIAEAFEAGVSDTYEQACERELRAWLDVPDGVAFDDWRREECAACELAREDHPYRSCPEFQTREDLGTFTLTIETGNAAMQTREDIADALARMVDHVARGDSEGNIRDENGNTVGRWTFG